MLASAKCCELRVSRTNQKFIAFPEASQKHTYQHPSVETVKCRNSGCYWIISSCWKDVRAVIQAALEKARASWGGEKRGFPKIGDPNIVP